MSELPFRQVHLDFHTSPAIPGVGEDFDPEEFIRTLQLGHVNSITVFAKCHHGYSYYPTEIGTVHPSLKRDLLGEMVEACHKAGIRVCAYTTVTWDELAWETHPEWRQLTAAGSIAGPSNSPVKPGWKNLDMNTGYGDYVIAQIEEVIDRYDVAEIFIDIASYIGPPPGDPHTLQQMIADGYDPDDPQQRTLYALELERRFINRCTAAIRTKAPEMGIFYNSRLKMEFDPALGNRPEMNNFTHLEIESLPGGSWGYNHFPLYVRYYETFDTALVAMTGRFHTTWGDFGGLRNRAALEFECFQGLAHGAKISIGDQLYPRGRLDEAVYQRIGEVYAQVEEREAWVEDSVGLPEIGVLTASGGLGVRGGEIPLQDLGTLHVLEQLKHQFVYLDAGSDFSPYAVVVLPDGVAITPDMGERLRSYVAQGGKLLICGRAGLKADGSNYELADLMGAHYGGPAEFTPDYLILSDELSENVESMAHSCELAGVRLLPETGVEVLAYAGKPYFNRTWQHFCSHQYTPLDGPSDEPAILQNGGVITLARPLFSEYAQSAKRVHKQVIANCLSRLLPQPRVIAHNLPSTAIVTVRRQNQDLIVHVLHYVHQRRGQVLDVIEDVLALHHIELSIRAEREPALVEMVPEQAHLPFAYSDGYARFTVPGVNGYQIVRLAGAAG
ncbi:MAG: alpha-L-fucosidase [Anaerolineae bacterium]|nr:alpha-L-fucosidase [Anaerolineae bacterium]